MDLEPGQHIVIHGIFSHFLGPNVLCGSNEKINAFLKFCSLKTNEERFIWAQKLYGKKLKFKKPDVKQKCLQKAEVLRREGNNAFLRNDMMEACIIYNHSIALSPPGSENLALAYGNRSAALMKREYPSTLDALRDIDLALKGCYPPNLFYKLLLRQGQCLQTVGRCSEAKMSLKKARHNLNRAGLTEEIRMLWETKIDKALEECIEDWDPPPRLISVLPSLSGGANPEIPTVSNSVTIGYTPTKGRHFLSTKDIQPGEVLMVDPSLAVNLMEGRNQFMHCEHCLKICFCLLPCDTCSWAMYCSQECLQAATKVHEVFCWLKPTLDVFDFQKNLTLKLKAILSLGIEKVIELMIEKKNEEESTSNDTKRTLGFKDGKYISTSFDSLYDLASTYNFYYTSEIMAQSLFAAVAVLCLDKLVPRKSCVIFGGALIKIMKSSLYVVPEFLSSSTCYHAVYGTTCLLNHSCHPNAIELYLGTHVVVRSTMSIKTGEEVTICYKSCLYVNVHKNKRQRILSENFKFSCKCEACENDFPLLTNLPKLPPNVTHDQVLSMQQLSIPLLREFKILNDHCPEGLINSPDMTNFARSTLFGLKKDIYNCNKNKRLLDGVRNLIVLLENMEAKTSSSFDKYKTMAIKIYLHEMLEFNKY